MIDRKIKLKPNEMKALTFLLAYAEKTTGNRSSTSKEIGAAVLNQAIQRGYDDQTNNH